MNHTEQEYEELMNRYNDAVDKNAALRARLALAADVAKAADRVATEVFGYERYDKAMGDLIDALRAYDAAKVK